MKNWFDVACTVKKLLQVCFFQDPLWKIIELMEKNFGSNVGASFYVTPPASQVFSPQQDDCEVIMLLNVFCRYLPLSTE